MGSNQAKTWMVPGALARITEVGALRQWHVDTFMDRQSFDERNPDYGIDFEQPVEIDGVDRFYGGGDDHVHVRQFINEQRWGRLIVPPQLLTQTEAVER